MQDPENATTHFGFEEVPREQKRGRVAEVFDKVASRYDLMNDCMSLGMHRLWKREFLAALKPRPNWRCLDVAGGTGDIAFGIARQMGENALHPVTVCDINPNMLHEGRLRAIDQNLISRTEWVTGNAEALPFPDASFDAYTIAFGIRNVTDIPKALREAYRVLRPGGKFMCLEFSAAQAPLLKDIYDAYSFHVIPRIGKLVAGDAAPYQYLVESIRRFPSQEAFKKMIQQAGFDKTGYRNLTGGIVAIHSGYRL